MTGAPEVRQGHGRAPPAAGAAATPGARGGEEGARWGATLSAEAAGRPGARRTTAAELAARAAAVGMTGALGSAIPDRWTGERPSDAAAASLARLRVGVRTR
eukprot:6208825-Pleurochrysis_carterae.AAC.1